LDACALPFQEGMTFKLSYQRFAKIVDTDGDKVVDKEEFFAGNTGTPTLIWQLYHYPTS